MVVDGNRNKYETHRSPALELNVVKGSSSTNVPVDSCEFAFCDRKCGNKFPESLLRKLPDCDWDIICQLPTDDVVDSFLWRENAVMGTVTGLVRLKWNIFDFFFWSLRVSAQCWFNDGTYRFGSGE